MDPYIERNMANYISELRRLFPDTDTEEGISGQHRAASSGSEPQASSSGESTSPTIRRPDTPYWRGLAPMDIDVFPPPQHKSHPPPRPLTKSGSSTDSTSPESADLNFIRRSGTPLSPMTWKPKPFARKITKTPNTLGPFHTPPSYDRRSISPNRFHMKRNHFQSSPEFYGYQSILPEPNNSQSVMPQGRFNASPQISAATELSPNAPGNDSSYYSSTPRSSFSWHDGYISASDSYQSYYESNSNTPQRSEVPVPMWSPQTRWDEPYSLVTPQESFSTIFNITPPKEHVLEHPIGVKLDGIGAITDPFRQEMIMPLDLTDTKKKKYKKYCHFCRKNGETPQVYLGHPLKVKKSKKVVVMCPILRSLVCSTCGASGDNAHTSTYCPVIVSSNNGQRLLSATLAVKNTPFKSNGKPRY